MPNLVKNSEDFLAIVQISLQTAAKSVDVEVCYTNSILVNEAFNGNLVLFEAVLIPPEWIGAITRPCWSIKLLVKFMSPAVAFRKDTLA